MASDVRPVIPEGVTLRTDWETEDIGDHQEVSYAWKYSMGYICVKLIATNSQLNPRDRHRFRRNPTILMDDCKS